jgi:hypothetical protein
MDSTSLKAGTGWIEVEVVSEPDVLLTFKGYAPILRVKVIKSGLVKHVFIGAKSFANSLEEMRKRNKGRFLGLRFRFKKESEETMSPYVVEEIR